MKRQTLTKRRLSRYFWTVIGLTTFLKMHGAGNDFVMLDGTQAIPQDRVGLAQALCSRHFGVGSDGLIILDPSEETDFTMDFYNPDGSQSFCGNGSRCAFAFARHLGWVEEQAVFEAIDGKHHACSAALGVKVSMQDSTLPTAKGGVTFLDTGSPHAVIQHTNVNDVKLEEVALPVRHHEAFAPGGTNVNVVERTEQGIRMRTFERGVEGETLACGTGVTAAALITAHREGLPGPISVQTQGGDLRVSFIPLANGFENIWLEGPAEIVFEGSIDLEKFLQK